MFYIILKKYNNVILLFCIKHCSYLTKYFAENPVIRDTSMKLIFNSRLTLWRRIFFLNFSTHCI